LSQLRGEPGVRRVDAARVGHHHDIGLGGCVVVTLYGKH